MEHDEKCERVRVAQLVNRRLGLSRGEYEILISEGMGHGICCHCRDRAMVDAGVKLWEEESEEGGEGGERGELVNRTIQLVLAARRSKGMFGRGRGAGLGLESDSEDEPVAEVIRVDFRMKRRL